eukprot:1012777-Pelagomonas_calceolata.AAC.1
MQRPLRWYLLLCACGYLLTTLSCWAAACANAHTGGISCYVCACILIAKLATRFCWAAACANAHTGGQ